MKFPNLSLAWRLLLKEPGFSAVVILGLAFGLAAAFLLLGLLRFSLTYNSHVPAPERTYVVTQRLNLVGKPEWMEWAPANLSTIAKSSGLPLQASAMIPQTVNLRQGTRTLHLDVNLVETSFPAIFGVRAIEGDLNAALSRPNALALTAQTAQRLFGSTHVVGRSVQIRQHAYQVLAVLPDPPANTTVPWAALAGVDSSLWSGEERAAQLSGKSWSGFVFVQLAAAHNAANLQAWLQSGINRSMAATFPPALLAEIGKKNVMDIRLVPLSEAYFNTGMATMQGGVPRIAKSMLLGLSAIAVLILMLALINYVNLATVRTLRRQREIGVRKVLGASNGRIILQFLSESTLLSLFASLLGLLLAWLLLPLFSAMVNRPLEDMAGAANILAALGIGAVLGLLGGIYPAWIALRLTTAQALAGRSGSESRGGLWIRRALGMLQFASAIGLCGITLVVAWQTRFAAQMDPGFDASKLLVIDIPGEAQPAARGSFQTALAKLPGVAGLTLSDDAIGRKMSFYYTTTSQPGMQQQSVRAKSVASNFFQLHAIAPVAGRGFDPAIEHEDRASNVVLNLRAVQTLGFASASAALGKTLSGSPANGDPAYRIVGVVANLRYQNAREAVEPMVYFVNNKANVITVRAQTDLAALHTAAEKLGAHYFPERGPQIIPAAQFFAMNYADETRLAQLLFSATVLALLLAAFGIYALAAYNVQRRTREIALRKLHGAPALAILRLAGRELGLLLLAGSALGLPLAAWASANWLAGFVERAPIGPWALLAALAGTACIAVLASWRHTLVALAIAPALALRVE